MTDKLIEIIKQAIKASDAHKRASSADELERLMAEDVAAAIFSAPLSARAENAERKRATAFERGQRAGLKQAAKKLEEICAKMYDHAQLPYLNGATAIRALIPADAESVSEEEKDSGND